MSNLYAKAQVTHKVAKPQHVLTDGDIQELQPDEDLRRVLIMGS